MKRIITIILPFISVAAFCQNVGIGTSTPKAALDVKGAINAASVPGVSLSSGILRLSATADGGLDFGIHTIPWLQAGFGGVPADFSLQALGGKVGIGTAAPQYLLHIKSTDDAVHAIDAGATGAAWNYYLQNGTLRSAIGWSNINNALSFYVNAADRMVINNNGNVGIGTTTPSYPLQFSNNNGDKLVLKYGGNPNNVTGLGTLGNNLIISGGDYFDQTNSIRLGYGSSSNGIASVLTVAPSPGKVGINNPNPSATLDVNGTFKLADGTQSDGAVLTSYASGDAQWRKLPGEQVCFQAYMWFNWQQSVSGTWFTRVIFDSAGVNNGNAYNPLTGIFTAPTAGLYCFYEQVMFYGTTSNFVVVRMKRADISTGGDHEAKATAKMGADYETLSVSGTFYLNAGEQVEFGAGINGTINVGGLRQFNYVYGYKIF